MNASNPFAPPVAPAKKKKASVALPEWTARPMRQTRPWLLLFAILGFVGGVPALIYTAVVGLAGFSSGNIGAGLVAALLGLTGAAFYVVPAWLLLKYWGAVNGFLETQDTGRLQDVLDSQARFWTVAGWMALVTILMAVVGVVLILALGISMTALQGG